MLMCGVGDADPAHIVWRLFVFPSVDVSKAWISPYVTSFKASYILLLSVCIGSAVRFTRHSDLIAMKPMQTTGAISWTELITSDLDGAVEFYQAVFGWKVDVTPMSTGPYAVGQVAGKYVSGMMNRPEESIPPYWGVYFTVPDVSECVAKAKELGAIVIMDTFEAPGVGKMAVLQDSQGAVFSVIAYSQPDHEDHQREWTENFGLNGAFSWYELRVPNAETVTSFYADLFGLDIRVDQMGMGPYHVFTVGGDDIGGVFSVDPEEMPPHWGCYVTVDDLDACNKAVRDNGGTIMAESVAVPGVGAFTMFSDPQGAVLAAMKYEMPDDA